MPGSPPVAASSSTLSEVTAGSSVPVPSPKRPRLVKLEPTDTAEGALGHTASDTPLLGKLFEQNTQVDVTESNIEEYEKFLAEAAATYGAKKEEIGQPKRELCLDPKELEVKRAAEEGCASRSSIGQRHHRHICSDEATAAEKSEYNAADRKGKALLRQRWAATQYEDIVKHKQKVEAYSKEEIGEGRWHTLGSLVVKYGGWQWPPAVQGAKTAALQCSLMGQKYCKARQETSIPYSSSPLRKRGAPIKKQGSP